MADTENKYYSQDEVNEKIEQEFPGCRSQILTQAKRHCQKLGFYFESEDLVHEAVKRFLDPRKKSRRWRRDLGIVQAFNGAMRSIADEKYEQINRRERKTTSFDESNVEVSFLRDSESQVFSEIITSNPENILISQEIIKGLTSLFPSDEKVSFYFECRCLGLIKEEIMEKLSISDNEYEALRKKVKRRVKKIGSTFL